MKIIKNAPKQGRKPKYPFDKMDIGDAFDIVGDEAPKQSASIYTSAKKRGYSVSIKLLPDGYRVQLVGRNEASK